ncbi:MAG: hypothetical protein WAT77_13300 [Paracoccaceae bacterium]|jgi:hypothetical protein
MSNKSNTERGGIIHLTLAVAIIGAVGLTGIYGKSLNELIDKKAPATRISMLGDDRAKCDANTVETLIGTLGCGSVNKGAKLNGITFLSAEKKK